MRTPLRAGVVVCVLVLGLLAYALVSGSDDARDPAGALTADPAGEAHADSLTPYRRERGADANPIDVTDHTADGTSPPELDTAALDAAEIARLWDDAWIATEQGLVGALEADAAIDLAARLLALVDPADVQHDPEGRDGLVAYPILADELLGEIRLLRQRRGGARSLENEFMLEVVTPRSPGELTGLPQDEARSARLQFHFGFDADDAPVHCTTHTSVHAHHTASLAYMLEGQPPLVVGGLLTLRGDGASSQQLTLAPDPLEDGSPAWLNAITPAIPVEGAWSADDARVTGIRDDLFATRPHDP